MQILKDNFRTEGAADPDNNKSKLWNKLNRTMAAENQRQNLKTMTHEGKER